MKLWRVYNGDVEVLVIADSCDRAIELGEEKFEADEYSEEEVEADVLCDDVSKEWISFYAD